MIPLTTAKRRFKRRAGDLMKACCERRRGGGPSWKCVRQGQGPLPEGQVGRLVPLPHWLYLLSSSFYNAGPLVFLHLGKFPPRCSISSHFPCWFTLFLHERHSAYWRTLSQMPHIFFSLPSYVFFNYSTHQRVEELNVTGFASKSVLIAGCHFHTLCNSL